MLKEIFLVHHTHMDVGYTDLPLEVMDQHVRHMDAALDLCERHAGTETPYFWTCESALLVQDYLACRPAPQRGRLLKALCEGWIELQAFLTQPLTELASGEELIECVAYAARLGRREKFPVECGMIDDIGGYAGRLPSVLAGCGVAYLVAGVGGFQVHLPWADLPHLFYLEDKAGARVLMWNLGVDRHKPPQQMATLYAVYGLGLLNLVGPYKQELMRKDWRGVEIDLARAPVAGSARQQFAALAARLEAEKYPYSEILLQYGGDNRGPDPDLPELVKMMNATGDLPHIRLTTPRHFFRHMQKTYGRKIPVVRGVMTDPWNIRANPTPSGLKTFRHAQRLLAAAETGRALTGGVEGEDAMIAEANRSLQLYADHTCGLSEWWWQKAFAPAVGCRAAAFDRYRRSWAAKRQYADAALSLAERLDRQARHRISAATPGLSPAVVVWNDTQWPMSGPAELYLGRDSLELVALNDPATGQDVSFQRIGHNRYLVSVPTVPAFGRRGLEPVIGNAPAQASATPKAALENEWLRLAFDEESGALVSLLDKRTGHEWADAAARLRLGGLLYFRVKGVFAGPDQAGMNRLETEMLPTKIGRVTGGLAGPIAESRVIEGHVDGPRGPVRFREEIILHSRLPRVDVRVRVDKPECEEKEAVCVVFPFAGRGGDFRFDQNIGWIEPSKDLIPGAMQDVFYAHSWLNLSAGKGSLTLAGPDAPMLQLGRPRIGAWEHQFPFSPGGNHVYAWLFHNLLNTDCPIWQDVLDEFRFGLVFHPHAFSCETAMQSAASVNLPLRADLVGAGGPEGLDAQPLLDISPASVRLISVRATGRGEVRLRLEETSGQAVRARIRLPFTVKRAMAVSLLGRPERSRRVDVSEDTVEFELPASSLVTLAILPERSGDEG